MSNPTFDAALKALNTLASEHGAQLVTRCDLQENGGCQVTVHYEDEMPLEAHVSFGADNGFILALVYDPTSYMNGVEEGLDDEQATAQARRLVMEWSDLEAYLLGQPYVVAAAG